MAVDAPAVQVEQVYQHVAGRRALDGVSCAVPPGGALLVLGPNGAGKTLLMRLILGLDAPSAGAVRVFGADPAGVRGAARRQLRQRVGAVLQGGALLDDLTVLENLLLPLRAGPLDRAGMARAARLVLTQLQLDGMEHHPPRALSLGQRRRVELARALIHRPALLVWDGLGDGLDPQARADIALVLRQEQAHRGLTLIATDNQPPPGLAEDGAVLVLERGQVRFSGPRAALAGVADAGLRALVTGSP
jgi:ABC-type multidrug transport system ATPase subunit